MHAARDCPQQLLLPTPIDAALSTRLDEGYLEQTVETTKGNVNARNSIVRRRFYIPSKELIAVADRALRKRLARRNLKGRPTQGTRRSRPSDCAWHQIDSVPRSAWVCFGCPGEAPRHRCTRPLFQCGIIPILFAGNQMRRAPKARDQQTTEAASADLTGQLPQAAKRRVNQSSGLPERVTELRVSARLMTLEGGLFCVFQAPSSPEPESATGLPGVRITPAPGITGRAEAVSVSTFRKDGWLNGTAALVRVITGAAQILITIYQDIRQKQDVAPQLKVLRLSSDPNATAPIVPTAVRPVHVPAVKANPEVMAHVETRGDVGGSIGEWIGMRGSLRRVEGFGIAPKNGIALEDIEYQAVLGRDWLSPWTEGGKYCGSRGMALPLLGLKVRLKGNVAKAFACSYSATFVDGSAVGPVGDGQVCVADNLAALEAFQIVIKTRAAKAADVKQPTAKKPAAPKIKATKSRVGR
jgi:hypothetical protein